MSKNKENEHFKNNPSERGGDSSNEKGQDSFQDTLDALEKDIQSLETELASKIDSISSSQDLRELREEVSRMQINKEVKDRFLKMIENVEKLSKDERKELLNEVLRDQEDAIPKVLEEVFPSHQCPYMRKLEDSPLGQDLLKDAA